MAGPWEEMFEWFHPRPVVGAVLLGGGSALAFVGLSLAAGAILTRVTHRRRVPPVWAAIAAFLGVGGAVGVPTYLAAAHWTRKHPLTKADHYIPVDGPDCASYLNYILATGLGQPGRPSVTTYEANFLATLGPVEKYDGYVLTCCGKGKFYSLGECTQSCKASLGGCLTVCEPAESPEVAHCVRSRASLELELTTQVSVLVPTFAASGSCAKELDRFLDDAREHETRHEEDLRAIIIHANSEETAEVVACAADDKPISEWQKILEEQLKEVKRERVKTLEDEIEKKSNEFHASPAGTFPVPDCSQCPP